jgi:hypothetical protein
MYEEDGGWGAIVGGFLSNYIPDFLTGIGCSEEFGWLLSAIGIALDFIPPVGWIKAIADIAITAAMYEPHVAAQIEKWIALALQIGEGYIYDRTVLTPASLLEGDWRGGEYMALTVSGSMGGYELTTAQSYENQLWAQEYLEAEWKSRPLAERIFDATDYRSTVAQVVNGAGINTMPSNVGDHFANWVKLIGAVPSFISGGLFSNKSAQAMALASASYDTGAPHIELSPDLIDKISGGDESYDYDNNATVVFGLLGNSGGEYRKYAEACLGLTIGSAPDYKVTAVETDGAGKALLVGLQGESQAGSWQKNGCNEKNKQDNYQLGLVFLNLDFH